MQPDVYIMIKAGGLTLASLGSLTAVALRTEKKSTNLTRLENMEVLNFKFIDRSFSAGGPETLNFKLSCAPARTSSDNIYLRLQFHTEFIKHRLLDVFRELQYFFTGCVPVIHEHQRLVFMRACLSHDLSTPATLLNEPARRQFHMVWARRIRNDFWILRS